MQILAGDACTLDMTMSNGMQTVAHRVVEVGVSAKEQVALGNIKSFCTGMLKKLAPPLLKEIETMWGVRAGQGPFTPRRNTWSVGVGNHYKSKAAVAEIDLLKTLGITEDDLAVLEGALEQL